MAPGNGEKEQTQKGSQGPMPVFLPVPEHHQKFPLVPDAAAKCVQNKNLTK